MGNKAMGDIVLFFSLQFMDWSKTDYKNSRQLWPYKKRCSLRRKCLKKSKIKTIKSAKKEVYWGHV